jgi:hypothetical protein
MAVIAVTPLLGVEVAGAAQAGHIAGFQRTESGTTTVVTTFVLPATVSCPPYFSGEIAGALLITSAGHTAGGVQLLCNGGVPGYLPFAQINGSGTGISHTVTPGDSITLHIDESPTATKIKVKDHTAGWSSTTTGAGANVSNSAVGIIAGDCVGATCSPTAQFSPAASFTKSSIDGQPLTGLPRVKIVDGGGTTEVSTSKLSAGGTAFSSTWVASCTPDMTGRC